jgi:hypothetical protein
MFIKILHVILLASVKYIITLPYALVIGLEYEQAIFAVLTGGIGGFLFFYYLSKPVFRLAGAVWPYLCNMVPVFIKQRYNMFCNRSKMKRQMKIFTRRNRFLARFRKTYGFWGIIIATPLFLTIPLGAFLAGKYYSNRSHLVLYMVISIIGWAGVLTGVIYLFPGVFFD